jgi:hypothetical protein
MVHLVPAPPISQLVKIVVWVYTNICAVPQTIPGLKSSVNQRRSPGPLQPEGRGKMARRPAVPERGRDNDIVTSTVRHRRTPAVARWPTYVRWLYLNACKELSLSSMVAVRDCALAIIHQAQGLS